MSNVSESPVRGLPESEAQEKRDETHERTGLVYIRWGDRGIYWEHSDGRDECLEDWLREVFGVSYAQGFYAELEITVKYRGTTLKKGLGHPDTPLRRDQCY